MQIKMMPSETMMPPKTNAGYVLQEWSEDDLRQAIEAACSSEVRALLQPDVDRLILIGALEPGFVL